MSEIRDWMLLPMELMPLITSKLPDLPDFIRFRIVCKTWSSTSLSGCPPQLPWLLEWLGDFDGPSLQREQRFYSLSSDETGTIHVEESYCNKEYRGPCCGYLLLLNEQGELSLFNPLTKEEVSLPPILVDFHWPIWIKKNRPSNEVMVVDQSPFMSDEESKWAYYHPDNKEWITKEGIYNNCCYCNGMLFSTEGNHDTEVFHVTSQNLLHTIPPPADEMEAQGPGVTAMAYLVESDGEILRVSGFMDWQKEKVEQPVFLIHKLNLHVENPFWVEISSIGDQMIFLDELNGFSISAEPFPGVLGNCIYFLDNLGKP